MKNVVAVVGRPNVGKSTLFNRLVGGRKAIVDEQSGVTRDRHYGDSEWNGKQFSVIDTGGYVKGSDDVYEKQIRRQVELDRKSGVEGKRGDLGGGRIIKKKNSESQLPRRHDMRADVFAQPCLACTRRS